MKVTLEKEDLIQILSEHFGSEFDVENITIRADPFEIEVRNVPMPASEKKIPDAPKPVPDAPVVVSSASPEDFAIVSRRADSDATTTPPPPGSDENEDGSPMSVIQRSREIELSGAREKQNRRRGGLSVPPPYKGDET